MAGHKKMISKTTLNYALEENQIVVFTNPTCVLENVPQDKYIGLESAQSSVHQAGAQSTKVQRKLPVVSRKHIKFHIVSFKEHFL